MTFNSGGSGGGSNISSSGDVALNNPIQDNVLSYNAGIAKWTNDSIQVDNIRMWDSTAQEWQPRPAYDGPVTAYSVLDVDAPPPPGAFEGDLWQRRTV